ARRFRKFLCVHLPIRLLSLSLCRTSLFSPGAFPLREGMGGRGAERIDNEFFVELVESFVNRFSLCNGALSCHNHLVCGIAASLARSAAERGWCKLCHPP